MTILSAVAALLTVAAAVTILVARSRRAGLMIYAVMSVLAAVLFSPLFLLAMLIPQALYTVSIRQAQVQEEWITLKGCRGGVTPILSNTRTVSAH